MYNGYVQPFVFVLTKDVLTVSYFGHKISGPRMKLSSLLGYGALDTSHWNLNGRTTTPIKVQRYVFEKERVKST